MGKQLLLSTNYRSLVPFFIYYPLYDEILIQKPEFVQPMDGKNVFKKFEVNGLMLYWNNLSDSCVRFFDPEALKV